MGSTISQTSDAEIFAAARRAYPGQRLAVEEFRVCGLKSESEVRLLTARIDRWKRVATAANKAELLMVLRSTSPGRSRQHEL